MQPAPELVVQTENLTKCFGKLCAVDNLNVEVYRGEVFGFLGPNGSGKSTTIGMLLGFIRPTSGKASVFGLDVSKHLPEILRRTGALTENAGFYPYLSGKDNLRYIARITGGITPARIDEVLELVELKGREHDPFSNYSMGMKQRLGVACALMSNPEFIILDEPTNGLDPAGMKEIRELIIHLGSQGKTVFVNSHLLHEVQLICSRVAIIKHGRVIAQGPVNELIYKGDILQIRVTDAPKALSVLNNLGFETSPTAEEDKLLVSVKPERAAEISAALARENIFLSEMKRQENTLEDLFLELTGEAHHA